MARPLIDENRRSKAFNVRVTETYYNEIKNRAQDIGLSITDYIIYACEAMAGTEKMLKQQMQLEHDINEIVDKEKSIMQALNGLAMSNQKRRWIPHNHRFFCRFLQAIYIFSAQKKYFFYLTNVITV